MVKRVVVLGGDGFCGWPTSLHLAANGYDVLIIDDLSRRKIDKEHLMNSLTPISPIHERLFRWKKTKKPSWGHISFSRCNVATANMERALMHGGRPEAVIHFAEQRAAPYSMVRPHYTFQNNIGTTSNILIALAELKDQYGEDIPLVHLGTTGVYGYGTPGHALPEGYINVLPLFEDNTSDAIADANKRRSMRIVYPYNPGSVYHLTKCMDNLAFQYYAKNYNLRITDLHQGIVWGTQTAETSLHKQLINRFDFDGLYGTVLNRFIAQAAAGMPLTVYGTGEQTRAFINIRDTVQCVRLAIENPAAEGEVQILNQTTEQKSLLELAYMIRDLTGAEIRSYKNPRNEAVRNTLRFKNDALINMGLKPTTLSDALVEEVIDVARTHSNRIDPDLIMLPALWDANKEFDNVGVPIEEALLNDESDTCAL